MTFLSTRLKTRQLVHGPRAQSARRKCICRALSWRSRVSISVPSNVRGVSTSRPPWCNSNRTPSFCGRLKKPRRNPDGSALSPRQH
jgi:hypothetical protein